LSGPFLDRIDIRIEVPQVSAADLVLPAPTEDSNAVRERVVLARQRQRARLDAVGGAAARRYHTNAELSGRLLEEIAAADGEGSALMRRAAEQLGLSARGFHRTLKVARTIADLDGADIVGRKHVAEALSYRAEPARDGSLVAA
jgi:magnesium chelatase family protein